MQLRQEDGVVLEEVGDHQMALARATSHALAGTRLLRYLMPHGDAMFNQAQTGDLRDHIRQIMGDHAGTTLGEVASRIEPLVERLLSETHAYLWFVGD